MSILVFAIVLAMAMAMPVEEVGKQAALEYQNQLERMVEALEDQRRAERELAQLRGDEKKRPEERCHTTPAYGK